MAIQGRVLGTFGLALTTAVAACYAEPDPSGEELCEVAAQHRAECTGEYITPPICDEEAQGEAERLLDTACEDFEDALGAEGKADGALCGWFGVRCTAEEPIFDGPACEIDADCAVGSHCAEGHCFEGVGSDEFADILDDYTGSSEATRSGAELITENEEARARREAMVESAENSLHITSLYILDDDAGRRMADLLIDAAARGVEVRLVVDAISQSFNSDEIIEEIAQSGAHVIPYNPVLGWARLRLGISGMNTNSRLHEKYLIRDGEEAIVGGRNTGSAYLEPDRKVDMDAHLTGPIVADVQRVFLELWDRNSAWQLEAGCPGASDGIYCPESAEQLAEDDAYYPDLEPAGETRARALYNEPLTQDTAHGYFTYLSMTRAARESIRIAAGYFIPPRRLRRYLREAAERGVEVQVLVNTKESYGSLWFMYYAGLNFYRELIDAGVEIYEYQGDEQMHAKTIVVDGDAAAIGSYNLSPRSATSNTEAVMVLREGDIVGDIERAITGHFPDAERADADIPLSDRIKARAHRTVEWIF